MITTKILKDSIYQGNRVTTFELEYPRYIHSELMTHRVFSRNCASSRAIPLQRMIELIKEHPVVPIWTKNQKGMQGELLNPLSEDAVSATHIWYIARDEAIRMANALAALGIHKQNANRLLEPFQTMKTILTGTQFNNFFKLRCHKAAMPEIQKLAEQMHAQYEQSVPKALWPWEWHTPYVNGYDCNDPEATEKAKKISVSCCAQVSYRKLDETPEKALQIFNKLIQGDVIHASAFEHVCRPLQPGEEQLGNLIGFRQYRHDIEQERNYNSLE